MKIRKSFLYLILAALMLGGCEKEEDVYKRQAWGCDLTYDYVKINADYRS